RAPVDIRAGVGILAVERGGIEGGGEPRAVTVREVVEAAIGALRPPLAGEHARRVLLLAAVGVHPAGVGVGAGEILAEDEAQQLAPVAERGHREPPYRDAREALGVVLA